MELTVGDRDGAGYDRLVADSLGALGVTAALERGGAGPAMLAAVAAGDALALTTTLMIERNLRPRFLEAMPNAPRRRRHET